MVAEQGDGAMRDFLDREVEHGDRIGAIADQVAEQHDALRPARSRIVQAGAERLEVAMDVGKDGDPHGLASC